MMWTAVSMCQPQPDAANMSVTAGEKPPIRGLDHRLRRPRRMEIDRGIELLGALQDRPEELVVEIAAAVVAVNDGADEFLLANHACSSSCAALSGAAVGTTARPAKRSGCRFTTSARKSLASRASAIASAASSCSVPGEVSDSTCMSMPAASISASRPVADIGELGENVGERGRRPSGLLLAACGRGRREISAS